MVGLFLVGAVLAAVHHAEVVAHRVGEPFGSLVLAVAVTVIEVALIVTLMVFGGDETATLARDTVFAAVMITCNGIVGLSLLVGALRRRVATFNAEGTGDRARHGLDAGDTQPRAADVHDEPPGPGVLPGAAHVRRDRVARAVRPVRVRADDPPPRLLPARRRLAQRRESTPTPPTSRAALISLALLLVALVDVVGLAKTESQADRGRGRGAGLPQSAVGVVIALLVLLPETLAAVRAARRDRVQTSLNLALGSAMASIGLTIPAIAIASIWLDGPLMLGLGSKEMVLLAITVAVGILTVRARARDAPAGRRAPRAVRGLRVPRRQPLTLAGRLQVPRT